MRDLNKSGSSHVVVYVLLLVLPVQGNMSGFEPLALMHVPNRVSLTPPGAPEGMESVGNRTFLDESVCGTVMNRPQQGSW